MDLQEGDRVAVFDSSFTKAERPGWFYDGVVRKVTNEKIVVDYKFDGSKENHCWTLTMPFDDFDSSILRRVRTVVQKDSFVKYHGQIGQVMQDCNGTHKVQLRFADGSESGWLDVGDLREATEIEYQSSLCSIRNVFHKGAVASYQGKIGKVITDCNSEQEVQLRFFDGSESSWLRVGALEEGTDIEYQQAHVAFCKDATVHVNVVNFAGCPVIDPTDMPSSTTVVDIKESVVLNSSPCSIVQVRLLDGSDELNDSCTLERFKVSGLAELTCVLLELSVSQSDRLFYLGQLSRASTYERLEVEFSSLDEAARADSEIVLCAVVRNGLLLRYAHSSARSNKEIVLEAVGNHGDALEFAAPRLRADREVALRAARQNRMSVRFADAALRANASFILEAGGKRWNKQWNGGVLAYACPALWEDMTFVEQVALREKRLLQHAREGKYSIPCELCTTIESVITIVKNSPEQLCLAPESMKNDVYVVLAAVRKDGETLRYAHEQMKRNRRVVAEAVRQNPQALRHAHPSLRMTGAGGKAALKNLIG